MFDISSEIDKYFVKNIIDENIESKLFTKACKYPYCLKTMSDGYFKNKRFGRAFNIYSYLVNINPRLDPEPKIEMYNNVGYMYKNGFGVEKSYLMAIEFYEKANNCEELKNIAAEIINENMKTQIKKKINIINDKKMTVTIVEKYCNRIVDKWQSIFDRRIKHDDRDYHYEEKLILHVKETKNINAAHELKIYFEIVRDQKREQIIVELLAQLGNVNACYDTYLHYKSLIYVDKNNAILAKRYLKLYFQRMLNKVNNIDFEKLSYTSFLPSSVTFED